MVDSQLLRMLGSKDASERKQAITTLARSQDRTALPHLAKVYRSDPDPEIRELARKAGVYINKKSPKEAPPKAAPFYTGGSTADDPGSLTSDSSYSSGSAYGDTGYSYGTLDDDSMLGDEDLLADDLLDDREPTASQPVNAPRVSSGAEARARDLLEQAMSFHSRGEQQKVIKALTEAFKKNPKLATDNYALNAASSMTGLPRSQVAAALMDGSLLRATRKSSGPRSDDDPTWGDAAVDLGIYWFVNLGLFIVSVLILIALVQALLNNAPDISPQERDLIQQQIALSFGTQSIPLFLLQGVLQATGALIGLLVVYLVWHLVAQWMLGGDGTFTRLIRKATLLLAFYGPLVTAAVFGLLVIGGALLAAGGMTPQTYQSWVLLVTFGVSIGGLLLISQRIGAAYRFGVGRGCATMIISYILIFCLVTSIILIAVYSGAEFIQGLAEMQGF
jgi:hypothetical protein